MKPNILLNILLVVAAVISFQGCNGQQPENWTKEQLTGPAVLAQQIKSGSDIPIIYCVGPGVVIPGSIDIGATHEAVNLQKFRDSLKNVPRSANLVIYCGCCPFAHCPNVRPAIDVLKEMKFTNWHLLDLPHNVRADWITKGYPSVGENK